jgi:hypothetical protein
MEATRRRLSRKDIGISDEEEIMTYPMVDPVDIEDPVVARALVKLSIAKGNVSVLTEEERRALLDVLENARVEGVAMN